MKCTGIPEQHELQLLHISLQASELVESDPASDDEMKQEEKPKAKAKKKDKSGQKSNKSTLGPDPGEEENKPKRATR